MNLLLGYQRLLFLALCLPFFLAHITPVLMKEECAKGSEDSCQNFKKASECGEGEHCQTTFGSIATIKSIACEACINLMTIIGNFMELVPEEVKEKCGYIGVCDTEVEMPLQAVVTAHVTSSSRSPAQEQKNLIRMKGELPCHLCHFIVQKIIFLLEGNKTKEAVMNRLEKVCSVIPKYLADDCRDLLEIYGQNILHLLLEMTNPDSLCSIFDVCHSKSSAHKVNKAQMKSNTLCGLCKMFDGCLDQILSKNSTQTMILHAFQKACSKFPGVYKEKCYEFVEQYEPLLIEALHDEMDPNSLCPKIGICPEAPPKPLMLETKQCVQGPSYWCKNMETATQCNAVELCKKHEWN